MHASSLGSLAGSGTGGGRGTSALAKLSRLLVVVRRLPSDEHVPIGVITVPAGNDWQRIRVARCTRDPPMFGVGPMKRIGGDVLVLFFCVQRLQYSIAAD